MANDSPSYAVKQLESQVNLVLRRTDWSGAGARVREIIAKLRQSLADSRLYVTDYELSEMRDEQLDNAKQAKKYLEQARRQILKASEYDIFGAVDTAHLTARIDQLAELK